MRVTKTTMSMIGWMPCRNMFAKQRAPLPKNSRGELLFQVNVFDWSQNKSNKSYWTRTKVYRACSNHFEQCCCWKMVTSLIDPNTMDILAAQCITLQDQQNVIEKIQKRSPHHVESQICIHGWYRQCKRTPEINNFTNSTFERKAVFTKSHW